MIAKRLRDMRRRSKLWARYRKLRAEHGAHIGAKYLLLWARTPDAPAIDWRNGRASLARDGFQIALRYECECDADLSYLGEFSRNPGAEGFRVDPDNLPGDGRDWPEYDGNGRACFYVPMNSPRENARILRERGFPKHAADCAARRIMHDDAARLARYWNGELSQYVLSVTVSRNGIELGSDHLGGIDCDGEEYFATCLEEHGMVDNAIREARGALAQLCKGKCNG